MYLPLYRQAYLDLAADIEEIHAAIERSYS